MNEQIIIQLESILQAYRKSQEQGYSKAQYRDRLNMLYLAGEIDKKAYEIMLIILDEIQIEETDPDVVPPGIPLQIKSGDQQQIDYISQIESIINENKGGQCSKQEYLLIADCIQKVRGGNVLIFGLGNDSQLWSEINNTGKTVFLEDHQEWIDTINSNLNNALDIRKVSYTTDISEWKNIVDNGTRLQLELDRDILETAWDLIFIDAPMGYKNSGVPGRMQSIYSAAQLQCTTYILHDVNRVVEKTYGDIYLGEVTKHVDKLNVYSKHY